MSSSHKEEYPRGMQLGLRKADKLKKPDPGPFNLTAEGLERLKEKYERLKTSLPGLIKEAERTAAYGDRSENDEYKEAKSLLRRTHRSISRIEHEIDQAVVITSGPNSSGTIQLGSHVTVETKGNQQKFLILGPHETDPGKGRISNKSPLGAALMGRKQGDIARIETTSGLREYRIIEVK